MFSTETDYVEIGAAPYEEACAQIGTKRDNSALNILECQAYIAALKRVYGEPPATASFRIKAHGHDFGTYRDVRLVYEVECGEARLYADKVEKGLAHWRDARMSAPVHYHPQGSLETEPLFVVKAVEDCFWPEPAEAQPEHAP